MIERIIVLTAKDAVCRPYRRGLQVRIQPKRYPCYRTSSNAILREEESCQGATFANISLCLYSACILCHTSYLGSAGHQTTGEGHGCHTKRTLASLSIKDKVVVRHNFPPASLSHSFQTLTITASCLYV
jgi:hypothetical protein